jgi:hypothetical protein
MIQKNIIMTLKKMNERECKRDKISKREGEREIEREKERERE